AGVTRGEIVHVDCEPAVRRERLRLGRAQPELITPEMDMWAAYLRGQADALALPIVDTTSLDVEAGADRLGSYVRAMLDGRSLTPCPPRRCPRSHARSRHGERRLRAGAR